MWRGLLWSSLESDYCRIERVDRRGIRVVTLGLLESDYCRIESHTHNLQRDQAHIG